MERMVKKPAVLILVNHDVVIYNFRLEFVERLLADGYIVHISSPYGERLDDLAALGARCHLLDMDRHGMNPAKELSVLKAYGLLIKRIHPVMVFGYTIKPNIYGAIAARNAGIPFVATVTGLGTAAGYGGIMQKITVLLYKTAFTRVQSVFFQNLENQKFFADRHIALDRQKLLPGSGVNLERFPLQSYPECGDGKEGSPVRFVFISRIMKEKGIEQYLAAAKRIKKRYPCTEFHVCGFCEPEYQGQLQELDERQTVIYHGMIRNVAEFLGSIHCVVHPTFYPEGVSNVLLEACSSGRPVITTDRSGCREAVADGVSGFLVPQKDAAALTRAIEKFLRLSYSEKEAMGMEGRRLAERGFNRQIVVEAYMQEIRKCRDRSLQNFKQAGYSGFRKEDKQL